MTAQELVRGFQSELHQQDRDPVAETDDVLYFLNKAQETFVKDRFAGSGSSVQGFEQSQDLRDDLRVIFEKDDQQEAIYLGSTAQLEGFDVDAALLPGDYLHLVSTRAIVRRSTSANNQGDRKNLSWEKTTVTVEGSDYDKRVPTSDALYEEVTVPIRLTQSQSVYAELGDPFHRSKATLPVADMNADHLNVYTDQAFIIHKVLFNYIREPKSIALGDSPQTSELPEVLHRELVEMAVRLYLRFAPQPTTENS